MPSRVRRRMTNNVPTASATSATMNSRYPVRKKYCVLSGRASQPGIG